MTDPQNPDAGAPVPPPANMPPPTEPAPPAYGGAPSAPPAYPSAPPAPSGAPANPTIPGKTLGIVALVVAIFFNVVGLILGIVALVQSRKAGYKNGPAVAAIIVGAILFVLGIIVGIIVIGAVIAGAGELARLCAEYGSGVHEINGVDITLNCG
jgi:hypothetical protein